MLYGPEVPAVLPHIFVLMIIVSYDISDDKTRNRFAKMLAKQGAIRLQFSVYEVHNTQRIVENLKVKIESFSKQFTMGDSVIVFEVDKNTMLKYGRAIHRDQPIVFL